MGGGVVSSVTSSCRVSRTLFCALLLDWRAVHIEAMTPRVVLQMLGQFIARAVADHALPLDFLDRYKGRVDCEHAR